MPLQQPSSWRPQTVGYRRVMVTGTVEQGGYTFIEVIDMQTSNVMQMPQGSFLGRLPEPGDVWRATRDNGPWILSTLESPAREDHGQANVREVMTKLVAIGLIRYEPWDSTDGSVERPYMAYLGECRLFVPGCAPSGWIRCDGSTHTRLRWRDLWDKASASLGVGDGSTTFTTPVLADVGVAQWYICAE